MDKPKNYILENAQEFFKGKIYDIWQWEQEMYDGSKKIFEKIKNELISFDDFLMLSENEFWERLYEC